MPRFVLPLVLSLLLVDVSSPQNKVPRFKDYPVSEVYIGKNAPLVLSRDDMRFRTRLREAAHEKPNLAGHYIRAAWGCGAECLMGVVGDAKTGKVYWLPHTLVAGDSMLTKNSNQ
jgi:hypothetical protein